MKIAVIGSGVSGLVSAYLLAQEHDVTVYEKDDRLGGHSHTHKLRVEGNELNVDTGFMVFNPERYPNFVELTNRLGVESRETKMSFSVTIPGEVEFNGRFRKGLFAKKSNIFNIRYLKFLLEIVRFRKVAKQELDNENEEDETLGEFLDRNNFSQDLSNWFLLPMLSAIWSMKDVKRVGNFPKMPTLIFLNNHKLLDSFHPKWRTLNSGSIEYVSKIRDYLIENNTKINLNAKINSVTRNKEFVTIKTSDGVATYDYVLFATHANVTKSLITDIDDKESKALGRFTYSINETVLHKDSSFVPKRSNLLAAWNFFTQSSDKNRTLVVTYCLNILQHIPNNMPLYVTLNPERNIDKDMIYAKMTYKHPEYNLNSIKGQQEITNLQGKNRTLYAGAHLGYGFHEDGVVSAIKAVEKLGVTPPWPAKI